MRLSNHSCFQEIYSMLLVLYWAIAHTNSYM